MANNLLLRFQSAFRKGHSTETAILPKCSCLVRLSDSSRSAARWGLLDLSASGGSRKKYFGGLAPHHLGGNNG